MDVKRTLPRRLLGVTLATGLLVSAGVGTALAGGPPGVGFYVDDQPYRTVGTPTDFSGTGAPASSFDKIYALGSGLMNVAEAKPGDRDFNGGRWMVLPVTWNVAPMQLTSAEQVEWYAQQGWLTIATTPAKLFECPVIPLGGRP
ncbi:MAG: hypothetical protein FIA92_09465 [Chloroflexi bacterium]|nr:hypothetical protein [Chloroflexota bacterium]